VWTGFQSAALDQAPNLFSSYNEVDVYGKITYAYRTYVIRNNNVRVSYLRSHLDQCINFKLATLTHNTLNSSQPAYLRSLLSYHIPARSLRSSNTNLLSVPRVHTINLCFPRFQHCCPLSMELTPWHSRLFFITYFPSYCFKQAFNFPQQLTQVPQIRPLADTAHYKMILFTYLLIYLLKGQSRHP